MTYSYRKTAFDPEFEGYVRGITNPNGRGNSAFNMDHERAMLPQDRLVYADITLGRTTGVAAEFGWASGRRDVWSVLDLPADCVPSRVVRERKALIAKLKKEHTDAARLH